MTAVPPPAGDAPARFRPCPICGRSSTAAFTPFCSRRCADIDLHRWLKGAYALPADPADEDGLDDDEPGRD